MCGSLGAAEEMEEKKKQEREEMLLAEQLGLDLAKADEMAEEILARSDTEGFRSTADELDEDEIDDETIAEWDANVAAVGAEIRKAAATPESAKKMREFLKKRMEGTPVKKSNNSRGKIRKRPSPTKKTGRKTTDVVGSPAFAGEVSDLDLIRAFAGSKPTSSKPLERSEHNSKREDGLPNKMNETDDDEENESWFPESSDFNAEGAKRNECSTYIQLFKGMVTQLVPTHGFFNAPYGRVEFWQEKLQDVPDVFDDKKPTNIGLWTDKRRVGLNIVKPGDVIRTIHSVAQNNVGQAYHSPHVRIFHRGPVYSKIRPMVVLWKNDEGMLCLPLYSAEWLKKPTIKESRKTGFMTVITESSDKPKNWEGYTPGNGKPLKLIVSPNVRPFKSECFVDVDRPVSISRSEAVQYKQAKLTRESFVRLMDVYTYRENEWKEEAFKDLGLQFPTGQPPRAPMSAIPGFAYAKPSIALVKRRLKDIRLSAEEIESVFS